MFAGSIFCYHPSSLGKDHFWRRTYHWKIIVNGQGSVLSTFSREWPSAKYKLSNMISSSENPFLSGIIGAKCESRRPKKSLMFSPHPCRCESPLHVHHGRREHRNGRYTAAVAALTDLWQISMAAITVLPGKKRFSSPKRAIQTARK